MTAQKTQKQVTNKTLATETTQLTDDISPSELARAYTEWATNLCYSPSKQVFLANHVIDTMIRLYSFAGQYGAITGRSEQDIEPLSQDKRFSDPAWQKWPFNLIQKSFLLNEKWWQYAMTGADSVSGENADVMEKVSQQIATMFSPANYMLTMPELLEKSKAEGNKLAIKESQDEVKNTEATGSGKVVLENELIELIEYSAVTKDVHCEPILIVPAWIMKYYLIDLNSQNSLVAHLNKQGFNVYMISWKDTETCKQDLTMEDYRQLGVMDALDAISGIVGNAKVHALGYFLGGTLLSIAAAAMAKKGDERIKTLSLFATQIDFAEAGKEVNFENESQRPFIDNMMSPEERANTIKEDESAQNLGSKDSIWARMMDNYSMIKRARNEGASELNNESGEKPSELNIEFLHQLIENNNFAEGKYKVDNEFIAMSDINAPAFVVDTERDHVVTWHSIYKIHELSETEITFILTSGGYYEDSDGVPSEPNRSYKMSLTKKGDKFISPENWLKSHDSKQGSWWPELCKWLINHSEDTQATLPKSKKKSSVKTHRKTRANSATKS